MENSKDKGTKPFPSDDEDIDLTLRLAPPSNEKQNLEEYKNVRGGELYDFFSMERSHHSSMGHIPMQIEVGASSTAYGGMGVVNNIPETPVKPLSFYSEGFLSNMFSASTHNRYNADPAEKTCSSCGVKSTPLWRKGHDGYQTMCNVCGLRHARNYQKG